jgi:hypothetical protein
MQSTSSFNRRYSGFNNDSSFDDTPPSNSSRSNLNQGSHRPESSRHPLPPVPNISQAYANNSDVSLQEVISAFDRDRQNGGYDM